MLWYPLEAPQQKNKKKYQLELYLYVDCEGPNQRYQI